MTMRRNIEMLLAFKAVPKIGSVVQHIISFLIQTHIHGLEVYDRTRDPHRIRKGAIVCFLDPGFTCIMAQFHPEEGWYENISKRRCIQTQQRADITPWMSGQRYYGPDNINSWSSIQQHYQGRRQGYWRCIGRVTGIDTKCGNGVLVAINIGRHWQPRMVPRWCVRVCQHPDGRINRYMILPVRELFADYCRTYILKLWHKIHVIQQKLKSEVHEKRRTGLLKSIQQHEDCIKKMAAVGYDGYEH